MFHSAPVGMPFAHSAYHPGLDKPLTLSCPGSDPGFSRNHFHLLSSRLVIKTPSPRYQQCPAVIISLITALEMDHVYLIPAFLTLCNVSSKYWTGLTFLILESTDFYKNITFHNSNASQECITARESPLMLETEIISACQELFSI